MTLVGRGLISEEIINQIKDRVDIVDIVAQHVSMTKADQNLKGRCPFHQDKTPSFTVSPSKQIFHCFGCGAGGNVCTFLTRITGANFPEVVRDLGRKAGIEVQEAAGQSDREREREQKGFEYGPGQVHVDREDGSDQHHGHFQEQIPELPDASFELRLGRPEL